MDNLQERKKKRRKEIKWINDRNRKQLTNSIKIMVNKNYEMHFLNVFKICYLFDTYGILNIRLPLHL